MNTKTAQKSIKRKNGEKGNVDYSNAQELVKTSLFGVDITNATTEEVLEYLRQIIQKTQKNIYIVTPNPEMLVFAKHHKDFQNILNQAQIALCDGVGLYSAARFLGQPLIERIIGTNFMEKVCEKANDWPITVGFLGGRPGVAEKAAECLKARFPGLKVVFASHEWNFPRGPVAPHPTPTASFDKLTAGARAGAPSRATPAAKNTASSLVMQNTKYQIQDTTVIDILFVAFGAPKQEMWMAEHLNKIPVRVMVGVGGAFDQIVDSSLRPPTWVHSLGLGWLYRLIREPWRLKRQLKLIEFIWLVLKKKFRFHKSL